MNGPTIAGTTRAKDTPIPTAGMPSAPPLPQDLEALLRRLRLPHIRRHAPEVVATAKAQRWEPVEVLRALFGEEAAGRERSALATRRAAAAFPTGKTFDAWTSSASSIPAPTQQALRTLEWGQPVRPAAGQEVDQAPEQPLGCRERRGLGLPYLPFAGRSRAASSASPASAWESSRAFAARNRSVAARTAATSAAGSIRKWVFDPCE